MSSNGFVFTEADARQPIKGALPATERSEEAEHTASAAKFVEDTVQDTEDILATLSRAIDMVRKAAFISGRAHELDRRAQAFKKRNAPL